MGYHHYRISFSIIDSALFYLQLYASRENTREFYKCCRNIGWQLEIQRVTLTDNMGMDILNIPEIDCSPDAVEVNNDQIRIKGSNCPQQICVNRGYISKPGEIIICLPHKMIIEIESTNGEEKDLIFSS